jgi:hypothetical protein
VEVPKKQTNKQDLAAAMPLGQLIKKINKENAPPGGWRPEDKAASCKLQASSLTAQGPSDSSRIIKEKL